MRVLTFWDIEQANVLSMHFLPAFADHNSCLISHTQVIWETPAGFLNWIKFYVSTHRLRVHSYNIASFSKKQS